MKHIYWSSYATVLLAIFSPCFGSNLIQCGSGHVHVLENVSLLSLYGLETEQLSVQAIAIDNTKLHWTLSSPELKTLTKATYRRFRILNVTRFSQLSGSFSYTLSAGGNNVYTSAKAYVHVGRPPTLSVTSNSSAIIQGKNGDVSRICFVATGAPRPNITLYRNGSHVSTNTTQLRFRFVNSCLEVYSINPGVYTLKAENCFGSVEEEFHVFKKPNVDISFKGAAVSVQTSNKEPWINVNVDGDLFVLYKVSGWPEPSVEWFHQNSPIQPSQFNKTHLTLRNVSQSDLGTYKVVVRNRLGKTEASFSLSLQSSMPTSSVPTKVTTDNSSTDSGNNGLPWWLLGVVAGACLLLVVIIITIVCICRSGRCGKGSRSLEDGIGLKPNSNGVTLHFIHNPTDGEGAVRVLSDKDHVYHEVSPGREASYEPITVPTLKKYHMVRDSNDDYATPYDDISDQTMAKQKQAMLANDAGYEEVNTSKSSCNGHGNNVHESNHVYQEVCAEREASYERTGNQLGKTKQDDVRDNKQPDPASTYML